MTCDLPIRDRSGAELPGVRCNLGKGHLGRCVQCYNATTFFDKGTPGTRYSELPIFTEPHTLRSISETAQLATVTPSEPSKG